MKYVYLPLPGASVQSAVCDRDIQGGTNDTRFQMSRLSF